jgi:voltage-gated potassium channel Kch
MASSWELPTELLSSTLVFFNRTAYLASSWQWSSDEMISVSSRRLLHDSEGVVTLLLAILGALLLVAIGGWLKWRIDTYEKDQNEEMPWFRSPKELLKIGGTAIFLWFLIGILGNTIVLQFNVSSDDNPEPRHLSVIEAINLAVQIVTTIGWGDITPADAYGQLFIATYILMGVFLIATVLSFMFETTVGWTHLISGFLGNLLPMEKLLGINGENRLMPVVTAFCFFSLFLIIGTMFYGFFPGEEKTLWEAFYMSVVTLSTVGFGIYSPVTEVGKLFGIFWMLGGVGAAANLTFMVNEAVVRHREDVSGDRYAEKFVDKIGVQGRVSQNDYLVFELVRRGFCREDDVQHLLQVFSKYDADNSGFLELQDFQKAASEANLQDSASQKALTFGRKSQLGPRASARLTERIRALEGANGATSKDFDDGRLSEIIPRDDGIMIGTASATE